MTRLPISGSDDGTWGDILNDFLLVEHNADGTQKTLDVIQGGTGATTPSEARDNLGVTSVLDSKVNVVGDTMTGQLAITRALSTMTALSASVTGDTYDRFALTEGGTLQWGSGSAAADITMARGTHLNTAGTTLNGVINVQSIDASYPSAILQLKPMEGVASAPAFVTEGSQAASTFVFRRANGDTGTPSATLSGETIGSTRWDGYGTTGWVSGASIRGVPEEDFTDSTSSTRISFFTVPTGSTASSQRMTIRGTGAVQIGASGTPGTVELLRVGDPTTTDDTAKVMINVPSSTTGMVLQGSSSSPTLLMAQSVSGYQRWRIAAGSDTSFATVEGRSSSSTPSSAHLYRFSRYGSTGTDASPTAAQSGDKLGQIAFSGYDGTSAFYDAAKVQSFAAETFAAGTNGGAYLSFQTTPTSSVTIAERMRLNASGALMIGSSVTATPGTVQLLHVGAAPTTVDNSAQAMFRSSATTTKIMVLQAIGSQAVNIFETQNASGGVKTYIDTAGQLVSPVPTVGYTGASATLALTDAGALVTLSHSSAMTLTVDSNANVAFNTGTVIFLKQISAGQVQVVAGSGVTINATPGLYLRTQYSTAVLIKYGTNTWSLSGDLST